MTELTDWAVELVLGIRKKQLPDFSGFGFVLYRDAVPLPVHPLVDSRLLPALPVSGLINCIDLVASASRLSSTCHDGFYLVRLPELAITHISQFLAPSIPSASLDITTIGGARQMAARLASLADGVESTIVCSGSYETVLYKAGQRTVIL